MAKLKVLYQSDSAASKTGFGRVSRALLSHLYQTGKYEIVQICCGLHKHHPDLQKVPWKCIGTLPGTQREIDELNKDPNTARRVSYGSNTVDWVVKEEKPDVFFGVQDIWGVEFSTSKPWFKEISSVIWSTLDSRPILPMAIEAARKVDNYWMWSDFATKDLKALGHDHVKTVHGPVDHTFFGRYSDEDRNKLRDRFIIDHDTFIVGFVFRNQLRKSVPNLLEGFAKFKKETNAKAKLLLHTHFSEGWNIPNQMKKHGIDQADILTTYICKNCRNHVVHSFVGQEKDCPVCKKEKSLTTTSPAFGVSEKQLADVYNLMDVYCHPFTSGGQEIPIQEAKFSELITLVTNYSCGEELVQEGAESLPLEWFKYIEHNTEFDKASTDPRSITKQLKKVYSMPKDKKRQKEIAARKWVMDNYSIEVIGKFFVDFLDSCPKTTYDFKFDEEEKNPEADIPNIDSDSEWVKSLYKNILNTNVTNDDDGLKFWENKLKKSEE